MNRKLVIAAASALLVAAAPAFAGTDITKALTDGKVNADLRARYENVDTANLNDADAFTGRARLGYTTGDFYGVTGMVEFEALTGAFGEAYNDTVNGKTARSVVADPETTEVNQAYLQYSLYNTTVRGGRQVIADWDNGRWVGSDNWRQNQTSYDGVTVSSTYVPHLTVNYGYVAAINNNIGREASTGRVNHDSNLINLSTDIIPYITVSGYSYMLDSDEVRSQASNTLGARATGEYAIDNAWKVMGAAEYAQQEDAGHNPTSYDLDYTSFEAGVGYKSLYAKVGQEVAEGNGGNQVIVTPFANAHALNGKADVVSLAGTGGNGLEDTYIAAGVEVAQVNPMVDGLKIDAEWHDFQAERGGADYGQEYNVEISKDFMKYYNAGVVFASFDADSTAFRDTDKVIVQVGAKF
jgi:hypothetical protein